MKGVLATAPKGFSSDYERFRQPAPTVHRQLQNIVTEYMKTSEYSVELGPHRRRRQTVHLEIITMKKQEVRALIDQTIRHFRKQDARPTRSSRQINNILNRASNEAGKIGRQSLDKDNRFVIMVNAGSKGKSSISADDLVPRAAERRRQANPADSKIGRCRTSTSSKTRLPRVASWRAHSSRVFLRSNSSSMMGGRVGLIDTAVKTCRPAGLRRLIKGLEDLKTGTT